MGVSEGKLQNPVRAKPCAQPVDESAIAVTGILALNQVMLVAIERVCLQDIEP